MRNNKAARTDEIVVEMVTALGDSGIEKLTDVINEIYDRGEIPEELSISIFIALPKKPGVIECYLHRTIGLVSHTIKCMKLLPLKICGFNSGIICCMNSTSYKIAWCALDSHVRVNYKHIGCLGFRQRVTRGANLIKSDKIIANRFDY